ncbi:unnamed protein product [Phytophthora fragariaefolia]|uniref:Unnamed protein product n=1 Tax=Phytophthora fragariaefolia TaxID=1490495 RepID=A0A9W6UC30_9STRA|nr:unnamed protein product [Phytophthora fragariaefolia]
MTQSGSININLGNYRFATIAPYWQLLPPNGITASTFSVYTRYSSFYIMPRTSYEPSSGPPAAPGSRSERPGPDSSTVHTPPVGTQPHLPPITLRDAIAARDKATRGQEEVTALLLCQNQDLAHPKLYLTAHYTELSRLQAEGSDLHSHANLAKASFIPIHDLQIQITHHRAGIQDFERHLARMTHDQDHLQASNNHLASKAELAGTEIHDLQREYADMERDLEDSEELRRISEEDLEAYQRTYNDTVTELNRLRAAHTATPADLDWEVAGRAASNRSAEVARMQLADLLASLQSSEETVDALGQRMPPPNLVRSMRIQLPYYACSVIDRRTSSSSSVIEDAQTVDPVPGSNLVSIDRGRDPEQSESSSTSIYQIE